MFKVTIQECLAADVMAYLIRSFWSPVRFFPQSMQERIEEEILKVVIVTSDRYCKK